MAPRRKNRADAIPAPPPAPVSRLDDKRLDGWLNILTGLGVAGKDWTNDTTLEADEILEQDDIDALYQDDPIAARIVDLIPQHATRRWIKISGVSSEEDDEEDQPDDPSSDFATQVMDALEDLDAQAAFTDWLRLNRKDGGAVMLLGVDDGQIDLSQPLDVSKVTDLRFLHPVERWSWYAGDLILDPQSEFFLQPETYVLTNYAPESYASTSSMPRRTESPELKAARRAQRLAMQSQPQGKEGEIVIHRSRLLVLSGIQASQRITRQERGWGLSVYQRCRKPIERYRVLWKHLEHGFKTISQSVLKMSGLRDLMASDKDGVVKSRIQLFQLMRSTLNIALVDADHGEGLDQQVASLAGVADLLMRCQDDIAAAAGLPLTLLFGHSPAGFSSDDEPGMRNFYDSVAMTQRRLLLKPLNRLIEILQAAGKVTGAPDRWQIDFLPLVEPTDDEISTRRLQDAQTANLYWTMGAVDSQEIRDGIRTDPHNPYPLAEDTERVLDEPAQPVAQLGPDGKPIAPVDPTKAPPKPGQPQPAAKKAPAP